MAKRGQVRLSISPREAQCVDFWLKCWQPPVPSPSLLSDQAWWESQLENSIQSHSRLSKQFAGIVRRKRSQAKSMTIIVDRIDALWLASEVEDKRGIFGAVTPGQGPFRYIIRDRLGPVASCRKGRKTLSRAMLEAGGFGSDPRHKKRLRARLKRIRSGEDWFERRTRAGLPVGLLALWDEDDPYPNLP